MDEDSRVTISALEEADFIPGAIYYNETHKSLGAIRGFCYERTVLFEKENPSHPDKLCDQIIPHRGDQKLFWDRSNWQALCHQHYSMKTRREDQLSEYRY